jgi:hypothetical protein
MSLTSARSGTLFRSYFFRKKGVKMMVAKATQLVQIKTTDASFVTRYAVKTAMKALIIQITKMMRMIAFIS